MVLLFGSIKIILIPISSSNFFPAGQQNCFGQIFVDFVLETRHLAAMPLPPPSPFSLRRLWFCCLSFVALFTFAKLTCSICAKVYFHNFSFFFVFANFGIHLRCSLSLTLSLSRSHILGCVHLICFASCANV